MLIYALVLYLLIGTFIAVYAMRKVKSEEDYYIGGRKLSGVVSALTYAATTYSAFMMIGLVGLSYVSGVGALGFELFYLVGTVMLLSYYAPKIWRMGREKGLVTPGDLLAMRYGNKSSKVLAILVAIALIPYTSLQVISISLLLSKEIGFETGIILSAIIIALWAFLGGMRSVAWTDAVFGVFMLLMAITAVAFATVLLPSS
ncbi:MAG: sodium:solute symporter family protein, partial [Archaeoglobaceae archaeon]